MLLLFAFALVAILLMARRPHKRYSRKRAYGVDANFQDWPFNLQLSLSTLAADTTIILSMITFSDAAYMMSARGNWSAHDIALSTGQVRVGFAHGDFTVVEIDAYLALGAPVSKSDKTNREISTRGRYIRKVGLFPFQDIAEVLNDGRPIKTKLRWDQQQNTSLSMWAQNSSDTPLTGDAHISFNGSVYGRWR